VNIRIGKMFFSQQERWCADTQFQSSARKPSASGLLAVSTQQHVAGLHGDLAARGEYDPTIKASSDLKDMDAPQTGFSTTQRTSLTGQHVLKHGIALLPGVEQRLDAEFASLRGPGKGC
jgi:hypothetical protein